MRPLRALSIAAAALGLVALRACAWVIDLDEGNRVHVTLAPTEWPDDASLIIERAWLAWGRVELVPCEPVRGAGIARAGAAYAHGGTSALRSTTSVVEALLGPEALELEALAPPTGVYCAVIIGADGAAIDAAHAPDDVDLDGLTLYVEGYQKVGGEWRTFVLRETAAFDVRVPLDHLAIDGTTLRVTLSKDASAWFDGFDPFADDAARALLERVQASIVAEVTL